MATFRKRGEYQWETQIRKKGFPYQTKTFNTKSEAEAWAAVIESEMVRGVFVSRAEAERTTLGQIIDRYIAEVTPTHRGCDSEALRLKAMSRHPLASRFLSTLTSSDFAKYRDERLKVTPEKGKARDESLKVDPEKGIKKVKPATVHRELGLFQQVIDQARREWGISLPENPLRLVSRPRFQNARNRRLSAEEEKYLIAALESGGRDEGGKFTEGTRNVWAAPAVKLALETAARQGEIMSLAWANVDLDAATAYLPLTKNGEARTVPLSRKAVSLLREMSKRHREERGEEEHSKPIGQVFPITQNALKHAWLRAMFRAQKEYERDCKKAGRKPDPGFLSDLRFHDLRHEATSRIAEKLSNILELASVTGHKDLQMLKRYYHPRAEDLAKKLG